MLHPAALLIGPFCSPSAQAAINLFPAAVGYPVLPVLQFHQEELWRVYFLYLAIFIHQNACETRSCGSSMYSLLETCSFSCPAVAHCLDSSPFLHSLIHDGYLGCFQVWLCLNQYKHFCTSLCVDIIFHFSMVNAREWDH